MKYYIYFTLTFNNFPTHTHNPMHAVAV